MCVAEVLKEKAEAHHSDGHHCGQVTQTGGSEISTGSPSKGRETAGLQPRWVNAGGQR